MEGAVSIVACLLLALLSGPPAELRDAFNAASDDVRVIAILSPT